MVTEKELAAGEAALKTYVQATEGWEADFVPDSAYVTGATEVIQAADAGTDQTVAGREASGRNALRAAIDSTGYGGSVTDQMCNDGASAILSAVAAIRSAS